MSIFRKKNKDQDLQPSKVKYGSHEYLRYLVANLRAKVSMLRKPDIASQYDWLKRDNELESMTDITPWEQIMDVDDFDFFTTLINEHMEMYSEVFGKKEVKIVNKSPHPLPSYAKPGDSGMDLRAWITKDEPGAMFDENEQKWFIELMPGETRMIHTGIYMELPRCCECQVRPRSGLAAKHGITVCNSPGTCDPNYLGEVCVLLLNTKNDMTADYFKVYDGDRIAQLVIANVLNSERITTKEIDEITTTTERGTGGFGHTGTK